MSEQPSSVMPTAYASYRSLNNFWGKLREAGPLPSKIDRSIPIMSGFSGSVQAQIMVSLRFFNLIDEEDFSTPLSKTLHEAHDDAARTSVLHEIVVNAYDFLFDDDFEVETATRSQVESKFKDRGLSGDTVNKAVALFTQIARDAGIKISPYITQRRRRSKSKGPSSPGTGRTDQTPAVKSDTSGVSGQTTQQERQLTWNELLLRKFPDYDSTWPDELKKEWFAAFKVLREVGAGRHDNDDE